jgi:hypothetical protein
MERHCCDAEIRAGWPHPGFCDRRPPPGPISPPRLQSRRKSAAVHNLHRDAAFTIRKRARPHARSDADH